MARNAPPKAATETCALVRHARIFIRVGGRHDQRRPGVDTRDDRDDNQRENNPHAENRDGDTPGKEATAPQPGSFP